MEILYENLTDFAISSDIFNIIENVIEETLLQESFTQNVEISFSFVNNHKIREINRKFRKIDKETDVLSFPLITDFYIESENIIPLGDIIISMEKAISQAEEYGHTLLREIAFLTVHSMLHLLGYDHITKDEEEIMIKKQNLVLNKLNITR